MESGYRVGVFLFTGNLDELVLRQQERRQMTTVNCPGINTDFVFLNQWFLKDCMSKNYFFPEIERGGKEAVTAPEACIRRLHG